MLKKIHLIIASARFCLARSLEFRSEILVWITTSIAWALIALYGINIIFGQVESIAGWGKNEVIILVLTQELFISLMWIFIIPSLLNLSLIIRTGNFDFYLLKPVSSRFLSSISRFEIDQYPRLAVLLVILWKLANDFKLNLDLFSFAGYITLLFIAVGIFYSIFFMITTTAFWFTRIFNLEDFFDSIMSAGRFPTFVYGATLRFVYFYVIPIVFIATFPVQFLLHKSGFDLIILGFAILTTLYFISNYFWNFALRHYSSASS